MPPAITPFLMFEGAAEAALNLYTAVFPDSRVVSMERYGPGEAGSEGSVKRAEAVIAGQRILCIDSPMPHGFTFTPSFSLFVECQSEPELDAAFARLSDGGAVMMPPGNYGFSPKFAWISDRFGVSWQLNLGSL